MHHSETPRPLPLAARRAPPRPVAEFAVSAAALAALVWLAEPGLVGGPALPALAVFGPVAAVALVLLARFWPHDRLGPANVVTLTRAALAACLAPAILAPGAAAGWPLFAVAALTLSLDGIDGWLARRSGLAGPFGARFDMEVDAVFAGLLALAALALGKAGPEVLLLGFMRYGFVAASLALPWLDRPLPDSLRRKAVCVVQIGTLVALLAPPVAPPLSQGLALAATALLAWSFAVDIRALARAR